MFGRRKNAAVNETEVDTDLDVTTDDAVEEGSDEAAVVDAVVLEGGPYDVNDPAAPDSPDEGWGIADFGSIRVYVPEGVEVRVDLDESTGVPGSIAVIDGESALQLMAFAAPKTDTIWGDIRQEIAAGISNGGGTVDVIDGTFGPELKAKVPVDGGQLTPARFMGVDGPRWFIRGVLTGPAAVQDQASTVLRDVFGRLVVHRDGEARPSQEMLPIYLPGEDGRPVVPLADAAPDLSPFERGPEITEVR